jgi:hypothetical protein
LQVVAFRSLPIPNGNSGVICEKLTAYSGGTVRDLHPLPSSFAWTSANTSEQVHPIMMPLMEARIPMVAQFNERGYRNRPAAQSIRNLIPNDFHAFGPSRGKFKEAENESSAHDRPSELAMPFELGREFDLAIRYFELAGTIARQKSANSEARMHFDRAISLLPHLPEGHERTKRELAMYAGLGGVLMATYGFGQRS